MGSTTQIDGEITITPPLPWSSIKDSPLLPANQQRANYPDTMLRVVEEVIDIDEGSLTRRSSDALVPNYRDETSGRTVLSDLQSLIDANPGHKFAGRFECAGEWPGDLWRVVVRGRTASRVDAQIIWPDENAEPAGLT